ncbi:MAG TPA: 1,4-dihydroxy-2-naphthoate polyprenyltransferase [Candidatus Hydrogenedens sp.]|nr:1,4-dihydroxy-2-naphthoate polyprenyltransferase [Candidatus Hydrogenedens sp.]
MSTEKPSILKVLFLTARPKTLGASIAPVIMGTALAIGDGHFHAISAMCALFGAILLQILSNYANDYFDFLKGADRENRVGPTRATSAGWLTQKQMQFALAIIVLISLFPGGYLIYRGGLPILIIGAVSLILAFAYTAGPIPLGYLGLGDLFVFLFFGPVAVMGTEYVQSFQISLHGLLTGISAGCFSVAILTVNNYRDVESDVLVGKRTLAVRFGKKFAQIEYITMLLVSVLIIPSLLAFAKFGQTDILFLIVLIIPAIFLMRSMVRLKGSELNLLLANTAKLLLIYSILFSVLWII